MENEKNLKRIEQIKNAVNNPLYDLNNHIKFEVQILIDNSLSHGVFKPKEVNSNIWYASSQTFKAMRKDIFALDEGDLDLKDDIECSSCKKIIDRQFWIACPFCLKKI